MATRSEKAVAEVAACKAKVEKLTGHLEAAETALVEAEARAAKVAKEEEEG